MPGCLWALGLWCTRRGLWRGRLPLPGLCGLSRSPSQVVLLPGGVGPSLGSGPMSFPPQTGPTMWANMWPSRSWLRRASRAGSLVGGKGKDGVPGDQKPPEEASCRRAWKAGEKWSRLGEGRRQLGGSGWGSEVSATEPQEGNTGGSGRGHVVLGPSDDTNDHDFWSGGIA